MSTNHTQELAKTLLRINKGEIGHDEAREVLETLDEVDLSLAEQELLRQGISPEELQGLCKVHLQVLNRQTQSLKDQLGSGHPLHTLISEHEMILGFVDTVEVVAKLFSHRDSWANTAEEDALLERLTEAAYELVETERHHQREEEALFPAIEEKGITGPTRIMRLEHQELRPKKKALWELAKNARNMDFASFKTNLQSLSSFIGVTLRDHIFKENTILYPAAYKAIKDEKTWVDIKAKCDAIGYCCFTPSV